MLHKYGEVMQGVKFYKTNCNAKLSPMQKYGVVTIKPAAMLNYFACTNMLGWECKLCINYGKYLWCCENMGR